MNFRFPWFRRNKSTTFKQDGAGWVVREDGGLTEQEASELESLKEQNSDFESAFEKSSKAWDL
ncbi:MAG: hypothetical protein P8L44_22810, partial [Opitutales bacterium]|nr:hypothetical protein [Opitutales bacterium]